MSVSSAMYAAITGLEAMGTAMSVISNNIANVNTIGFKGARSSFQDLLSQNSYSASGSAQIGRGVVLGAVTQVFSQGSFSNSTQDTDIAISGEGFFAVRDQLTEETFYTRAGNFQFDADGRLVSPNGYVLQGWELNSLGERIGTPTDVIMSQFNAEPEVTTLAHLVANLDSGAESRTDRTHLSSAWSGDQTDRPLDGDAYVYQTSIQIYDSLGNQRDISIYFDPDDSVDNKWDYIITCDPEEDVRTDDMTAAGNPLAGTVFAGLLQRGTITFEPTDPVTGNGGQIREITADNLVTTASEDNVTLSSGPTAPLVLETTYGRYTGSTDEDFVVEIRNPTGGALTIPSAGLEYRYTKGTGTPSAWTAMSSSMGPYALDEGVEFTINTTAALAAGATDTFTLDVTPNWTAQDTTTNGYFQLTAAFLKTPEPSPGTTPPAGTPVTQDVEFSFGARNLSYTVGNNTSPWTLDTQSTTQYAAPSSTIFQTQDGFASGYLQGISIDPDGVLTGSYSNGRNNAVFQIGLALFRNPWGLEKIGNNLYSQSRDSGQAVINPPGEGGTGTVAPNALEQSNVDLAEQFVDMIIQQRGFQANSKVITTTDTMMAELINLKR